MGETETETSTPDPDETIAKLREELAVVIDEARDIEREAAATPTIPTPFDMFATMGAPTDMPLTPDQWAAWHRESIARARRKQLEMVDDMLHDAERRVQNDE